MRFTLSITCDNASFGNDVGTITYEVGRILQQLGTQMLDEGMLDFVGEPVRDYNGNAVGRWCFVKD